MKRKKMIRYMIALICIILSGALLPYVIRAGADILVGRIQEMRQDDPETETEEGSGTISSGPGYTFGGIDQKKDEDDKAKLPGSGLTGKEGAGQTTEERIQEKKTKLDKNLQDYRDSFHPKVQGTKSGLYEIFIKDREAAFLMAVADHMYSVYGDSIEVSSIDIADFISDDDSQVSCQILVHAGSGEDEELAYYMASYNKQYDFYSIYAYQE